MKFSDRLSDLRHEAITTLVTKIQELTQTQDYIDLENADVYMSETNGLARRLRGITKDKYVILESKKIFVFEIQDDIFLCELTDAIEAL